MWKTLYKLARTLQDYPGSKRVAEIVRGKVDNFKKYLPVLETICNPGIHDRHWAEVIRISHFTIYSIVIKIIICHRTLD